MKHGVQAAVLLAAMVGIAGLVGCDNHPRPGQEAREEREPPPQIAPGERPEEEATRPDETEQVGEHGAGLAKYTEPMMMQCIEVLETTMKCTAKQPFMEALLGEFEPDRQDQSRRKLETLADYWREPGGRRQSCHQLMLARQPTPFKEVESLETMAAATDQMCVEFAGVLTELEALDDLLDINL